MNSSNSIIHYPHSWHGPTFGPAFDPGSTFPVDPWVPPGDTFPMNPSPQPSNPPLFPHVWLNPAFPPTFPSWWPKTDVQMTKLILCTTCKQMYHSETCPFCLRDAVFRVEVEIGRLHQMFSELAFINEKLVRQMDALLTLSVEQKPRKKSKVRKPRGAKKSKKSGRDSK